MKEQYEPIKTLGIMFWENILKKELENRINKLSPRIITIWQSDFTKYSNIVKNNLFK